MTYDFNSIKKAVDEASNRPKFYTDFDDVDTAKLHQISELTEWIRTKGKGSDVREIVAQLFERTFLEGAREGNANLEVAQARGEFDTLSALIKSMRASDKENLQKNNILDVNKVDKNGTGQVTWSNLAQDAREQISGNKVAVVGMNSVGNINIVDGSVTNSKLTERMGFGVMLSGRLKIDAINNTVTMAKGSWYQVGKSRNAPNSELTCPFVKDNGTSQYIVYNDLRNDISVYTLANIMNITNRDTILAITYADSLIYPQYSRFIETVGIEVGERSNYINAEWGTLIQGRVIYDPKTKSVTISKEGSNFIVSYRNNYYTNVNLETKTVPLTGASFGVYFNVNTKEVDVIQVVGRGSEPLTGVPSGSNKIKLAEIYLNRIHHISNAKNINSLDDTKNTKIHTNRNSFENILVELQTKPLRIVCFGDSTTDGYRTSDFVSNEEDRLIDKTNTYPNILNTLLNNDTGINHTIINRGFSGKTIEWLDENINNILSPVVGNIDYAMIMMGINGLVYNAEKIKSFKNSYISVLNKLSAKGIKPILCTTQAEFENYKRFGEKISSITDNVTKSIAIEYDLPLIDYNKGTRDLLNNSNYNIKNIIPDMCHFGDLGHKKGAEFIASQLIPRCINISSNQRIGYQSNKVISDLTYSDFTTDSDKEVKWITKTNGFDLEGQLNTTSNKSMFKVAVYIERPTTIEYFGDNVSVTINGDDFRNGTLFDVGYYNINVTNMSGLSSKFRGLKFVVSSEI